MIKVFDVNPFVEAVFYYAGRANGLSIEKKFTETIEHYPEKRELLHKTAGLAVSIERELNLKLKVNEELVNKFFKKFDGKYADYPYGFCLAHIMTHFLLIKHLDYSVDEMCKYLRECSMEERLGSLRFGLADKCEAVYFSGNQIKEFSSRVEKMQLSFENKWKILNAAFDYQTHIEELISLIKPAAAVIQAYSNEYQALTDKFREFYSRENAQPLFESFFGYRIKPFDIMKICPLILGFDRICAAVDDNTSKEINPNVSPSVIGRMFLGIACHLLDELPQDEVSSLCEKIQTLSDSNRLKILFYLCSHRVYGQELCTEFGLARSALSYHISKLLASGFVTAELSGGKTFYTADKAGIRRMLDTFAEKIG